MPLLPRRFYGFEGGKRLERWIIWPFLTCLLPKSQYHPYSLESTYTYVIIYLFYRGIECPSPLLSLFPTLGSVDLTVIDSSSHKLPPLSAFYMSGFTLPVAPKLVSWVHKIDSIFLKKYIIFDGAVPQGAAITSVSINKNQASHIVAYSPLTGSIGLC